MLQCAAIIMTLCSVYVWTLGMFTVGQTVVTTSLQIIMVAIFVNGPSVISTSPTAFTIFYFYMVMIWSPDNTTLNYSIVILKKWAPPTNEWERKGIREIQSFNYSYLHFENALMESTVSSPWSVETCKWRHCITQHDVAASPPLSQW